MSYWLVRGCIFISKLITDKRHGIDMITIGMSYWLFYFYFLFIFYFLKDFIYFFLERGEGRENERERNINVWLLLRTCTQGAWPATQACALTGNQTSDPLVHRPLVNSLSHTSQDSYWLLLCHRPL